MIDWKDAKSFWNYLEFYPESDEEGYDGEHDGGIKGIRDDAPKEAKEAYKKYLLIADSGVKV
jgi:hypothetical protein